MQVSDEMQRNSHKGTAMNTQPVVSIIILNWNDAQGTIAGLDSVFRLDYVNYRVVVCDNGSTDNSLAQMKAWARGDSDVLLAKVNPALPETLPPLTRPIPYIEYTEAQAEQSTTLDTVPLIFIRVENNAGFTGGANIALAYTLKQSVDFVLFLDNDALIAPDALNHMVQVAHTADAAMVGALVRSEDGEQILFAGQGWPAHLFGIMRNTTTLPNASFLPSYYADGAGMLLRRDLLQRRITDTGHFVDPDLFMYCEDTDFCLYGRSQGYRCVVATRAVVYHGLSKSHGGAGNPNAYYYITRNRLLIAKRWLRFPWNIIFHLYYAPSRLPLQFSRFIRRQPTRWRPVLQGVAHGYRQVSGKWNSVH